MYFHNSSRVTNMVSYLHSRLFYWNECINTIDLTNIDGLFFCFLRKTTQFKLFISVLWFDDICLPSITYTTSILNTEFRKTRFIFNICSIIHLHNQINSCVSYFPGEILKCVREVSLFDECPFKRDVFLRIAQSFPFINRLCVTNQRINIVTHQISSAY